MKEHDPIEVFYRQALAALARRPRLPPDDPQHQALIVCLGPPAPSAMAELRTSLPPATCLFWIYSANAPNPEIEQAAATTNTCTLTCHVDVNGLFVDKTEFLVTLMADRRVQLLRHNNLDPSFHALTARLDRAIRNAIENISQDQGRGLIRLRSSICNLPAIWANAPCRLQQVPPNTPAIICGAGPTLVSHLQELRRIRERALLIAVGHALPAMIRADLQPDLVVADDSRAWWEMPQGINPDMPLVACAELTSAVASHFKRVLWCKGSSLPFSLALQNIGLALQQMEMRKTVTIHAIDVALQLGCEKIIMVAQDLSLADDGTLHVAAANQ